VSITISLQGKDMDLAGVMDRMDSFFKIRCTRGVGSSERGISERYLHFQGVAEGYFKSAKEMNEEIKMALGWTKGHVPHGAHVTCKSLMNKGLHTWHGMIGYCTKDRGQEHYNCISHNISQDDFETGAMEYVKFGKADVKSRVTINRNNILERAFQFHQHYMRRDIDTSHERVELVPVLKVNSRLL